MRFKNLPLANCLLNFSLFFLAADDLVQNLEVYLSSIISSS